MSEMETVKGALKEIQANGRSIEDVCQDICIAKGFSDLESFYRSYEEKLRDSLYDEFIIVNGVVYKFINKDDLDPYGFSEASMNDDGTINFFCMWYNGGGSLSEVLESAINSIEKGDK